MLFNKLAVKYRKPLPRMKLVSSFDGCEDAVRGLVDCKKFGILDRLVYANSFVSQFTKYDHKHRFQGTRTASQTLTSRKGDCIEKQNLLREIMLIINPELKGSDLGITVLKNPKGYDGDKVNQVGVHPFVTYRNNSTEYAFDSIGGYMTTALENISCVARVRLNQLEFQSFRFKLGAEDLSFNHDKHEKALEYLKLAEELNPNDYTIHSTRADVLYLQGNHGVAEQEHAKAILIAPDLADPHVAYGEFCLWSYEDKGWARKEYVAAAKKRTRDAQVLHSLERGLREVGEIELSSKVSEKKSRIMRSKIFH